MSDYSSKTVYIIIPVHNRKAVTLKCLGHLDRQGDLDQYQVVVVDDGSTDRTQEAIQAAYPTVIVLHGDGNLWWTGAICRGMEYAVAQGAEYLVWLNDDCLPQPGAIAKLLDLCKTDPKIIVGGQAFDPITHQPSYGGVRSNRLKIIPLNAAQGEILECDGLNGNLVCMSSGIVRAIGYPQADRFPQYHGDTTYTHQAQRKGYHLLICGDAISSCQNDHPPISWLTTNFSIFQLYQERFKIKSPHYLKAHFGYYRELLGIVGIGVYMYEMVIKFWIISIMATMLPYPCRIWLKHMFKGDS